MSTAQRTNLRAALVCVVSAVGMAACLSARATTEAQAVDELIAVLGETLPCTRYAVAWLADPASKIEHLCIGSLERATLLGQEMPRDRVYYTIDMESARDRYASVYRVGGTPTPAVVLAQFLATLATIAGSQDKVGHHFSPLMVYSRSSVSAIPAASLAAGPQPLEARRAVVFPR
jgi:hypothetical protein